MVSKTEQLKLLVSAGNKEEAIKLASTFKLGLTKDEKRCLEIAKECLTGRASFYEKILIDCNIMIEKAYKAVKKLSKNK